MDAILNRPFLILLFCLLVLWLAVLIGTFIRQKLRESQADADDLNLVTNATLTLLALIVGFTFSMAVSRYDQRKNYEEEEANAIGTEYVRADFLPAADAARTRALLTQYLDQRILFYTSRDENELDRIDSRTAKLQSEMWTGVQRAAAAQPTPIMGLVALGMNDVLNRQGYTQAAWWNRIPTGAWALMMALGICCSLLIGYGAHDRRGVVLMTIFPLILSIAFFLIADIDSPRRGVIRVLPQNLMSLSDSLHQP